MTGLTNGSDQPDKFMEVYDMFKVIERGDYDENTKQESLFTLHNNVKEDSRYNQNNTPISYLKKDSADQEEQSIFETEDINTQVAELERQLQEEENKTNELQTQSQKLTDEATNYQTHYGRDRINNKNDYNLRDKTHEIN